MTGKWHERNFPLVLLAASSWSRARVCLSRPIDHCMTLCRALQRSKTPGRHPNPGFHRFGQGDRPASRFVRSRGRQTDLLLSLCLSNRGLRATGDRHLHSRSISFDLRSRLGHVAAASAAPLSWNRIFKDFRCVGVEQILLLLSPFRRSSLSRPTRDSRISAARSN